MSKDPAFPWYASDWLGSTKRALMSLPQRAAYLELLSRQWSEETCSLPDDDKLLSMLSDLGEEWFNGSSGVLRECFPPHPKLEGRVANPRLLKIRAERDAWRAKSSRGGKRSVKARKRKKLTGEITVVWRQRVPLDPTPCIYLLIQAGEPFYVGQAQDLMACVTQHRQKNQQFDDVRWIPVPVEHLLQVEEAFQAELESDAGLELPSPGRQVTIVPSNVVTNIGTKVQAKWNTPSPSPSPSPSPFPSPIEEYGAQHDSADQELVDWCLWWNQLHEQNLVPANIQNPEHPTDGVQAGWKRVKRSRALRDLLAQRETLRTEIRQSSLCRQGWFRLEKLFGGKNRDGELIVQKLLDGAYRDNEQDRGFDGRLR